MPSEQSVERDDRHVVRPAREQGLEWHQVQGAIQGIRYGEVRIVVQDGLVVQIDRTEKQRVR